MTSIWGQPISMICVLEVDDTVGLRLYTYIQQLFYLKMYVHLDLFLLLRNFLHTANRKILIKLLPF